ncbi:hypothetical protein TYRP_017040, partial [Tyrophagus putrescentiae]|jgi:hypothetical protein
LLGI